LVLAWVSVLVSVLVWVSIFVLGFYFSTIVLILRTGDIQTVALLCAQISKRKMTNSKLEQWIELYARDMFLRHSF
jgi:hypothetical protein